MMNMKLKIASKTMTAIFVYRNHMKNAAAADRNVEIPDDESRECLVRSPHYVKI
jgi:hypothetical protein